MFAAVHNRASCFSIGAKIAVKDSSPVRLHQLWSADSLHVMWTYTGHPVLTLALSVTLEQYREQ